MNDNNTKALSGITIIDLTRVLSGPYCTMILADHGARVIKVEIPETGDDTRQFGPYKNGISGYFSSINRGKESIALNLKNENDRLIFEQLLAEADVVTENFRPGTMDRLGYSWEILHEKFPKLIYGSISGFGHTDNDYQKLPAYDMVVQGMSGIMTVTGHANTPPTRVGVSIGDIAAGLFLTIGITMSLLKRTSTGVGNQVDIAMLDCQLALLEYSAMRHMLTGETPSPVGTYRPGIPPPFGMFKTVDGYMVIATGNDKLFAQLCTVLNSDTLSYQSKFSDPDVRRDSEAEIQEIIEAILAEKTTSQWCELLSSHGIPCGPVNTVNQMLADPYVKQRSMLVEVDNAKGPTHVIGTPIKMSGVDSMSTVKEAPELDQDRDKILRDFNVSSFGELESEDTIECLAEASKINALNAIGEHPNTLIRSASND